MNKLISLKHLHYLITLYDYQHFGRAASACFISQSTLSAAISNLEETLDAALLEREHKHFIFTTLGEEVVRRGRLMVQQNDELVDYAKNQGKLMEGKFYLGVIPTIAPFILSELQILCQQHYPDLSLFIREDTTDNVLQALGEGKLDLVLLALPYPSANFQTQILANDYFKLVLPHNWLQQGIDTEISKLPENSIFLLEKEHCLTEHTLKACQLKDSAKINPFFATSLHTLIQMVNHQPGITFLPELAINSGILEHTDLVAVPLKKDHPYRQIGAAWRATSPRIASYHLFLALAAQIITAKCAAQPDKA